MRQYINIYKNKNDLLIRELVDGKEVRRKLKFHPYLFQTVQGKTNLKNFYQTSYVERVNFQSSYEMKQFMESYKDMENEIWGTLDFVSQFMYDEKYDSSDSSLITSSYIDIEVCTRYKDENNEWIDGGFPDEEKAEWPINAICDYREKEGIYYCFTTAQGWSQEKSKLKYSKEVKYIPCSSEKELLKKWLTFWIKNYPHVVTGWNLKFDISYLYNRITKVFSKEVAERLSPFGIIETKTMKTKYGDEKTYKLAGISVLDYLLLYKKYNTPKEKYTLDYISSIENKDEHKLHFEGTHGSLYYDDPVFFVDYNIQDVRCIVLFERKLQFMKLAEFIAYTTNSNFEDIFSQIHVWENFIFHEYLKNGLVLPLRVEQKKDSYEGAFVFEPEPGFKDCIVSFDFTSLYPSIMRLAYMGKDVKQGGKRKEKIRNDILEILKKSKDKNAEKMLQELDFTGLMNEFYIEHDMIPEVTKYLQEKKLSMTTNFEFYDISKKSLFITLITEMFFKRKANKKTSFKYKHQAQDIAKELEKRGISV